MDDVRAMLDRQAAWQRSRAQLPWEEKLRMALVMRDAVKMMQRTRESGGARDPAERREGT